MNWLALSPAEIAVAWAGLAAAALWLYLHHRRPRRRKVSTLRFWASVQPVSQPRRRKLREPWAFLAQVLFLLLLVLALANPRWGSAFESRSVAIVLDTSIWSQTHPAGEKSWIDLERAEAVRLLDSLPGGDRVLLLRAEADAPPILPFTTDLERFAAPFWPRNHRASLPIFRALWKWAARRWEGRDAACWFTWGLAWWIRSKRATWTNFARKWNLQTTTVASLNF